MYLNKKLNFEWKFLKIFYNLRVFEIKACGRNYAKHFL